MTLKIGTFLDGSAHDHNCPACHGHDRVRFGSLAGTFSVAVGWEAERGRAVWLVALVGSPMTLANES